MKILPVVMMVCLVFANVYAVNVDNIDSALTNNNSYKTSTNITGAAANIWQTIATVIQILAIAAVVFAGLRYMFASADQKADIKKSMGVLAIGAVLVFGATLVLQLIAGATSVLETTK